MTSNSEQYYENIFVVYFAVNFAGCFDEFHVFFKHFENLEISLGTFRRKNCISIDLSTLFS